MNNQFAYNKKLLYILAREIIDLYREKGTDPSVQESLAEMCFSLARLVNENEALGITPTDQVVWKQLFDFFDTKQHFSGQDQPDKAVVDKIYKDITFFFENKSNGKNR